METASWDGKSYTLDIYSSLDSLYASSWLSTEEKSNDYLLDIVPIPVGDVLTVPILESSSSEVFLYEVYSLDGILVYYHEGKALQEISASLWKSGVYVLRISILGSQSRWHGKFVKDYPSQKNMCLLSSDCQYCSFLKNRSVFLDNCAFLPFVVSLVRIYSEGI